MIKIDEILALGNRRSIKELNSSKSNIDCLNVSRAELIQISNDMFKVGSKSHLRSLNPLVREELGYQLEHLTNVDPQLQADYKELKNKYLSLGRSYASISYLFDLVDKEPRLLDVLLMHELLLDDGAFRTADVSIQRMGSDPLIISADGILDKVENLFEWYNSLAYVDGLSQTVLATMFHYYLVKTHPFNDGNGRISRLFLNLILLKGELFPIVVPDDRRRNYYESLISADTGDFSSLIDLVAELEKEKADEYLKLAKDLSKLEPNIECLVLTEDGNTEMIENLLDFHGFDLNKTAIESYDGKDNIASAVFLAKKMKDKDTAVKQIIFHRDRDNDQPQQLNQMITKLIRNHGLLECSTIFITKFYDMESYFINDKHVSEIFPTISVERSKRLVELATVEASDVSKKKMRLALCDYGRYGKIPDPEEKSKQINELYESDPIKFRYGKEVLFRLEKLVGKELGGNENVTLVQKSKHIKIPEFENTFNVLNA